MTSNKTRPIGRVSGIHSTAAAVAIALSGSPAAAQTAEVSADDQAIEEIVVTGSRLIRRDYAAPSPITSLDADAIKFSGQALLESALNKLPQITPDFSRTANNPGDGTSRINLRGLGSNRTLVMMNGRRIASAGIGSAVDINSLPQSLMQRVEVITGGATTVYGSDAVSGVVNFITKQNFDGLGLDASVYATERGDSNIYDINLKFGHNFANGRGNVTVFAGYYDREPLFMGEREIGEIEWFDLGDGQLTPGGSSGTPEGTLAAPRVDYMDGSGPSRTIFDANGDPRRMVFPDDVYNYAPVNYLQVPLTRFSGGLFFNYDMNDRVEFYSEINLTQTENRQNLAPVPVFAPLVVNFDNPVLTPATRQLFTDNLFPAGPGLGSGFFTRRMLETGARIIDNTSTYSRVVAGLRGDLTENWEFDAWVIYNKADQDQDLLNAISFSRFQQGLLVDPLTGSCFDPSNGCVPVDMFGLNRMSPEAVDFVRAPPLASPIEREQQSFSAFLRGDLFATWAGPIQVALGVEWRQDEGSFEADELIFGGDILGYSADAPVDGTERVSEIYMEAILPLAQDAPWADYLGLEVGGRYSEYKNAGSVDSWKAGLEWQPNESLRFRTMAQRSVRAPNLLEAFQQTFASVSNRVRNSPADDLCSASADPIGNGRAEKCELQGIPANLIGTWEATVGLPVSFFGGGNPDLTPEVAETFTAGIVIQPAAAPQFQIAIDYFDLRVEDTIGDLDAEIACFDSRNTTGIFCNNMVRDPVTFDLIEYHENKINKGVLNTNGIDTQLNWSTDIGVGDLVVDLVWTHMLENSFQETSFGTLFDCGGKFGAPCNDAKDGTTYPRDRITTNFNYNRNDINAFLNWRWISGSTTNMGAIEEFYGAGDYVITEVNDRHYFDLGLGYRFNDNVVARMTVANITDQSPVFMAWWGRSANTDPGMYDIFGRSYTLAISMEF